ncbi:MAG TPA: CoA pyrophosphatase [Anaerolineales bacterium]|nr:CoA pyrophosphatase [Anaerolineales bacterium]
MNRIDLDALTEADIRARLSSRDIIPPDEPPRANIFNRPRRRAGVLIPFTRIGGAWHLLFIRRSEFEDDHHGGQVAFPGGGTEAGDADILATALREAREETGLRPEDVRILGRLNDLLSITNYLVSPVVAAFDSPYPFTADNAEVARIFTIPLAWLADPDNLRAETRENPGEGSWPILYYDLYDGELLWGFTAGLTQRLLNVLR